MRSARTIVLVTLGSIGDLLPFVAVGRALHRRGHPVIVATHSEYEAACRIHGLDFRAIWDGRRSQQAFGDVLTSSPVELWNRVWREFFLPAAPPTFAVVRDLAESRPCIVVAAWSALGAIAAGERSGIPVSTVYLSPYAIDLHERVADPAGQWVREIAQVGCGPAPHEASTSAHRTRLAFFPRWFAPGESLPEGIDAVGFPFHDDALAPVSLTRLRRFVEAGEPPIIFTPGSFMDQADAFFAAALRACTILGRRALFLTPHRRQIPANLPDTVLHLDYVPLRRVFDRCAAVFHHGGIGTCAQALRGGVPQVIAPVFFDQFDNAERVRQLGAGCVMDRHGPSGDRIAQAVEDALALTAARSQRDLSARFKDDAVERACSRIESLVRLADGEPMHREAADRPSEQVEPSRG